MSFFFHSPDFMHFFMRCSQSVYVIMLSQDSNELSLNVKNKRLKLDIKHSRSREQKGPEFEGDQTHQNHKK